MKNKNMLLMSMFVVAIIAVNVWAFSHKPKVIINENIFIEEELKVNKEEESFDKKELIPQEDSIDGAGQGRSLAKAAPVGSKNESLPLELLGTALGNLKDPIAFIKDLESGKILFRNKRTGICSSIFDTMSYPVFFHSMIEVFCV